MDLDELQSVQSRERQTDSLQQLRESFYQEAGDFIEQLSRERERAAERADDPWNSPEVGRISDDIDTAEQTVEAIYERRVGKIVKMASLAAADMPTEDEGLTAEERSLFDTLVGAIENNRTRVEAVLDGHDPADVASDTTESTAADTEPPAEAAETGTGRAAGDAPPSEGADRETAPPEVPPEEGPGPERTGTDSTVPPEPSQGPDPGSDATGGDESGPPERAPTTDEPVDPASLMGGDEGVAEQSSGEPTESGAPATDRGDEAGTGREHDDGAETGREQDGMAVDRTTVKITDDVGEIFGVDDREYELSAEDVVTLPSVNAEPLVESDAAERLD